MDAGHGQTGMVTGAENEGFSLSDCRTLTTLPARDIARARRFYAEKLGLTAAPGAAPGYYLYHCGGVAFSLYETSGTASGTHDQMAFTVPNLEMAMRQLKARGVTFRGDVAEDERTRTAWFKDSEDNLLMLREILVCPLPDGVVRFADD